MTPDVIDTPRRPRPASWARAAAVRAIRTAAQAALALVPTTAITIGQVDWPTIAGGAALAAALSGLAALAGLPEATGGE